MTQLFCVINSLPNCKNLDGSKFKGFADNKLNINEEVFLFLKRVKILEKGESAKVLTFTPFPTMFLKAVSYRFIKTRDCVLMG